MRKPLVRRSALWATVPGPVISMMLSTFFATPKHGRSPLFCTTFCSKNVLTAVSLFRPRRTGDTQGRSRRFLETDAGPPASGSAARRIFLERTSRFFCWLESGVVPTMPATYQMAAGETVLRERTLRLSVSGAAQSFLEIIRFSAANHLCVDLEYRGSVRRIEPYSLRRTRDGNIVLHAIRASDGGHRSRHIPH